ncbi:MAG TPA: class I SAM-dependent methyltransferase, partial [Tepidisphaeraceae bacterium]|nr:class I SAM-dependent methyltransferase [Tepidisphaeraceae bacterium]
MSDPAPIRPQYDRLGPDAFYKQHGSTYANPHAGIIRELVRDVAREQSLNLTHCLDLAAGAGEATLGLLDAGAARIDAIDPYTHVAYQRAIGRPCEQFTFEQIAQGALRGRRWSLIVCSFALHLVERSRLPALCLELADRAPALLILTPHKRPIISSTWGWKLRCEALRERVYAVFKVHLQLC